MRGREIIHRDSTSVDSEAAKAAIASIRGTMTLTVTTEDGQTVYSGLSVEIFEGPNGQMGLKFFYPIEFEKRR